MVLYFFVSLFSALSFFSFFTLGIVVFAMMAVVIVAVARMLGFTILLSWPFETNVRAHGNTINTDSGYGTGKGSKGSTSSNSQNRIMSSDSALFTTRNNTKVIAQRGGLAVLPCAVKWNPTATVSFAKPNQMAYKYTHVRTNMRQSKNKSKSKKKK